MGFSAKQLAALRRDVDPRHIRTREAHGRQLSYLEGWYVVAQANRIFGHDGWSRETTESRCVLARENRGSFLAIYVARVRITFEARGARVIREGSGSGEGRGSSPAEAHDTALKAAETDATKRALSTFGKPFGLELYRSDKGAPPLQPALPGTSSSPPSPVEQPPGTAEGRVSLHPDDTAPIPRPSRYYGRRQTVPVAEQMRRQDKKALTTKPAVTGPAPTVPPLAPTFPGQPLPPGRIDKSVLTIAEPKRLRDKNHLRFVASQPCLICGRQPSDPHHLRFAQPRAIGLKVSDEFTVPLCRGHHRELHQAGNEVAWWENLKIDAMAIARALWEETHPSKVESQ